MVRLRKLNLVASAAVTVPRLARATRAGVAILVSASMYLVTMLRMEAKVYVNNVPVYLMSADDWIKRLKQLVVAIRLVTLITLPSNGMFVHTAVRITDVTEVDISLMR